MVKTDISLSTFTITKQIERNEKKRQKEQINNSSKRETEVERAKTNLNASQFENLRQNAKNSRKHNLLKWIEEELECLKSPKIKMIESTLKDSYKGHK